MYDIQVIPEGIYLFVQNERWVILGQVRHPQRDAMFLKLEKAANVRWWKEGGLGRLAREGPSEDGCCLDPEECEQLNRLHCHRIIRCDDAAWAAWLEDKHRDGRHRENETATESDE